MAFSQQIAPQNEWELKRLGKLTSSEISVLLVDGKSKWGLGVGALSYCEEKVCETMTGTYRGFSTFSTEHGNINEPRAIERLKELHPNITYYGEDNRKFFSLNAISGGSPDAIDEKTNTVFEIKAPENPQIHLKYLRVKSQDEFSGACKDMQGTTKKNYYTQLQFNMLCVAQEIEIPFDEMNGNFVSYGMDFDPEYNNKIPDEVKQMFGDTLILKILPIAPDIDLMQKLLERIGKAKEYMEWYIDDLYKTLIK